MKLSRFCRSEDGYVMVLALIAMPLMLGFALLVIDVSRGNNLHTDLQNAVDGLALAGARELDGGIDAIDRSNLAISTMLNNQARFGDSGNEIIDETKITVTYLTAIPPSDDDPIDAGWIAANSTADDTLADYVLVRSLERPITSIWPVPVSWTNSTVNMQAEAVATYTAAACDITPLFICNPFEPDGLEFEDAFQQGMTYSREFRVLKTEGAPGPGNFGLLQTEIHLREAFGMGTAGACYSKDAVTTKPGVTYGQVREGLNVRFDIYAGAMSSQKGNIDYRPARNVRKGDTTPDNCNKFDGATDGSATAFPSGSAGTYPDQPSLGMTGDNWDRAGYWSVAHGGAMPVINSATHPTNSTRPPSRYDVYRYEIANERVTDASLNGETGTPQCYTGGETTINDNPDRRMVFAAVVNCDTNATEISGRTVLEPDAFASLFLINPVQDEIKGEKPISLEVVDVTGFSGNNTLDLFLREESILVR